MTILKSKNRRLGKYSLATDDELRAELQAVHDQGLYLARDNNALYLHLQRKYGDIDTAKAALGVSELIVTKEDRRIQFDDRMILDSMIKAHLAGIPMSSYNHELNTYVVFKYGGFGAFLAEYGLDARDITANPQKYLSDFEFGLYDPKYYESVVRPLNVSHEAYWRLIQVAKQSNRTVAAVVEDLAEVAYAEIKADRA